MPVSGSLDKACSVGSFLREHRESRGFTLDDAARVTRIGKNYLAAIEEERFDTLPNPAYTKGFLRAYAAFLGLSGDQVIALYEKESSCAVPDLSVNTEKTGHAVADKTARSPLHRRWSVPLILLVLVLVASYLFRDKDAGPGKSPVVLPAVSAAPASPSPVQPPRSSVLKPLEHAVSSREEKNGGSGPAMSEVLSGGIVLKLKANQDSSLNVTIDGLISQQYDLKTGDLIEWKADKVITLDVGNAGGVEAELNGKSLKPFGEPNKFAHVVLKADVSSP